MRRDETSSAAAGGSGTEQKRRRSYWKLRSGTCVAKNNSVFFLLTGRAVFFVVVVFVCSRFIAIRRFHSIPSSTTTTHTSNNHHHCWLSSLSLSFLWVLCRAVYFFFKLCTLRLCGAPPGLCGQLARGKLQKYWRSSKPNTCVCVCFHIGLARIPPTEIILILAVRRIRHLRTKRRRKNIFFFLHNLTSRSLCAAHNITVHNYVGPVCGKIAVSLRSNFQQQSPPIKARALARTKRKIKKKHALLATTTTKNSPLCPHHTHTCRRRRGLFQIPLSLRLVSACLRFDIFFFLRNSHK